MRAVVLAALVLLTLVLSGAAYSAVLGTPGSTCEYVLAEDISNRPEYEQSNGLSVVRVEFSLGPVVKISSAQYQWFKLKFTRKNGQKNAAWLLMNRFPSASVQPDVYRYLWLEYNWPDPLEYRNATSGRAELPRLSLWKYGWPRDTGNKAPIAIDCSSKLPAQILFQGYVFKLASKTKVQASNPPRATVVKLRPDALIGLAGTDKDRLGRHKNSFGAGFQYEYDAPPSKADVQADLNSGLNFFFNHRQADKWLNRTGCYVTNMYTQFEDWPADLYRSNFFGRAWMVDEPCVYFRAEMNNKPELANKLTPAEAARGLEKMAKDKYNAHNGQYGRDTIASMVNKTHGLGKMQLIDHSYPVWEVWWDTTWYQLAGKDMPDGLIDEDINPEIMIERLNMAFGTMIPALMENACEIRIAVARGAARNFNKDWGTSIYSYTAPALNPKLDAATFKYLYDAGCRYFFHWFGWVGLTDAQVPYSYKRFYADAMQKYINQNPKRDINKLMHAADTCIVLPYGYAFSPEPMFRIRWLSLDRKNKFGVSYRQVLANAAAEMENMLHEAVKFDMAVDEPRFTKKGYKKLIYIREDGRVDVVQPGKKTSSYRGPVVAKHRVDLGEMPTINLTTSGADGVLSVKATFQQGTGELARNINQSQSLMFSIDVLYPNGDYKHTDSSEFVSAADPGVYHIRAATADCFGRPAIATADVEVK